MVVGKLKEGMWTTLSKNMNELKISFPRSLEDEAIYILRETAAQFERPALLFSGGKDSIVLVHLAMKAFYPAKMPFPLVHIDTGHNFPEALEFRDDLVQRFGLELIVVSVEETIRSNQLQEESGRYASRNGLQSVSLLETIEKNHFDACIGGARRDEEKARAKERIFSVRNAFGEWNAQAQRPELFEILNGHIQPGENVRVFPISNWTEWDVWSYIKEENIEIPKLYFAHKRKVFQRDGLIWPVSPYVTISDDEPIETKEVRFRTVGDMTCTAAVLSEKSTIEGVMTEIASATISERGARIDDKRNEAAMELRKQNGYF
jgi:sulfate adenylyltransferase subunit 2